MDGCQQAQDLDTGGKSHASLGSLLARVWQMATSHHVHRPHHAHGHAGAAAEHMQSASSSNGNSDTSGGDPDTDDDDPVNGSVSEHGPGTQCCMFAVSLATGKLEWQHCYDMDRACAAGIGRHTATTIVYGLLALQ